MRVNGVLKFILSDQLGSTSVVTSESGAELGRMGYYPFGKTRYSSGSLSTDRLYTGQQQVAGIGLYNYKARYYDATLGRFISADTITPGGTQGLNRYSYVNNSPVNRIDPTGHMEAEQCGENAEDCSRSGQSEDWNPWTVSTLDLKLSRYGVEIDIDNISFNNAYYAYSGVKQVASALGEATHQSPVNSFRSTYGSVKVVIGDTGPWMATGMYLAGRGVITINPGVTITSRQMAHELGHVFEQKIYTENGYLYTGTNNPVQLIAGVGIRDDFGNLVTVGGNRNMGVSAPNNGYCSDSYADECQWHPRALVDGNTPQEDWADIFMNWSFNSFMPNAAGRALYNWTQMNMSGWVNQQ